MTSYSSWFSRLRSNLQDMDMLGSSRFFCGALLRASSHRDAALGNGLVQPLGEILDALGGGVEGCGDRALCLLGAARGDGAGILQRRELRLEALQLFLRLRQLVGQRERCHDGQPRVADLAEARAQARDAIVEIFRELCEMLLFTLLARHPELSAVDGDADLRHGIPA